MLFSGPVQAQQIIEKQAETGQIQAGEAVFKKICSACHSIEAGYRHRVGPNLHGIVGRANAQAKDYPYTASFRAANVIWDELTLTRFLKDPKSIAPGTKMDLVLTDDKDVAAVIAFLRNNSPSGLNP
jgi:cytochrome c